LVNDAQDTAVGLKDRATGVVTRASTTMREVASAGEEGFNGLRRLASGTDEQAIGIEDFLLALVQAVRADELPEERSSGDLHKTAKRRRQRLALCSWAAGPFVGLANQTADLYCDTATVCDLVGFHRLELSDERIAAHMLVLWSIADDLDEATAAVEGHDERRVTGLVMTRLREVSGTEMPETLTKRGAIKVLWQAGGFVGDAHRTMTKRPVKAVLRPGKATRDFIERAEHQLGVSPSR
jgi:hypothetical protein